MDQLASLSAIIVDAAVKATLLLALAWAACAILKNRSAATRHAVRALVMSAVLLLPLSGFLPGWHVSGLPQFAPSQSRSGAGALVSAPAHVSVPAATAAGPVTPALV